MGGKVSRVQVTLVPQSLEGVFSVLLLSVMGAFAGFFVLFLWVLFIHERHRERQRPRQREKQALCREPGTPDSWIHDLTLNDEPPRCPICRVLNWKVTRLQFTF